LTITEALQKAELDIVKQRKRIDTKAAIEKLKACTGAVAAGSDQAPASDQAPVTSAVAATPNVPLQSSNMMAGEKRKLTSSSPKQAKFSWSYKSNKVEKAGSDEVTRHSGDVPMVDAPPEEEDTTLYAATDEDDTMIDATDDEHAGKNCINSAATLPDWKCTGEVPESPQ